MKCSICNLEVESKELYKGDLEEINGAVLGDTILIKGHKICCQAVDDLVVQPNRSRLAIVQELTTPVSFSKNRGKNGRG